MDSTLVADADVPGESEYVDVGDVRLHAVTAGPEDGPLAVLLHGFPEFWYGWCEHVRPFAEAGYRVVVPDQRGYNLSDKPPDVAAYRPPELAGDVVGLLDALGRDSAHLVGHDWGAMVAWWTALSHPDRVDRLVPVNVPHPAVFRRTLKQSWEQRLRSAYAAFFQLPRVPERLARAGDWRLPVESMRRSSRPGTFSATDFERYRTAWSHPDAYRSMLNWYRATVRYRDRPPRERVTVPTLVVWGARDRFLARSMARESADACDDGRLALFPDATHWVHHEEPVRVADRVIDFLGE